ncbi:MAG TPA: Gfo/Idh/MocA family oxidoreductase [Candidatus Obscuribacterales bacterium]
MRTPTVAVAGSGYWGKNLVRNFHQLGALAAICEPSEAGQAQARELAPEVPLLARFEDLLADQGIGAVVISTPAVTHYELSRQALLAGKDVFCEKPLALNYRQAAELVKLAKERERILMVGHILEYHPAILALRELVASGELGAIRYLYSHRLNLGKIRREENILWSFAPHDIAVILRLTGELPFQVIAHGGSYIQPNIADVTMTQLGFDNGVSAHIFVSWLNPFKEQKLVVVGSRKMAVFDDVAKSLVLFDQRVDICEGEPVPVRGEGTPVAFASDEPLKLECQAFLAALATRLAPITDGESGLRVLKVLQAAQRSLITNGQTILLPME